MTPNEAGRRYAHAARLCLRAAGTTLGAAFLLVGLASTSFFATVGLVDGERVAVRLASDVALAALEAIEAR